MLTSASRHCHSGPRSANIFQSAILLALMLAGASSEVLARESFDTAIEPLDTFRPYVRADYAYDSNLFRLENDAQARALLGTSDKSETYHTLAAGLDMDWRIRRQVLKARLEANQRRFNTYKQQDFNGYNGLLQWDWRVGKYAAGDLGLSEARTQSSFTDLQNPIRNLLTTRQSYAHGGVKLALPWQVNLGVVRTEAENSAASQQALNYQENKYSAGLQYQTTKGSTLEFVTQYRQGEYPNRQIVGLAPVGNDYRQYDNGFAAAWAPSVKTQLKGQLNYTRRLYEDVPQRNFSGITGRAAAEWLVTGKTSIDLALYRDIGVVENNTASYSLNQGLALSVDWRPTAKLAFIGRAVRERQTYEGDPGFVLSNAPTRQDDVTHLQLEAQYQVLRKTRLGLVLQHGERQSNQALAGYGFNSAHVSVRSEF